MGLAKSYTCILLHLMIKLHVQGVQIVELIQRSYTLLLHVTVYIYLSEVPAAPPILCFTQTCIQNYY